MKQQANLIRAGQVIEHDGRRWTVLKQQIITPGKGGAFIQVEMRDLKSGNKTNERWRTADTVERLMTEEREYTYSYTDGENLVLMDPESFEQTMVPVTLLGEMAPFLQDNMAVTIDLVEGDPVGIHLPGPRVGGLFVARHVLLRHPPGLLQAVSQGVDQVERQTRVGTLFPRQTELDVIDNAY